MPKLRKCYSHEPFLRNRLELKLQKSKMTRDAGVSTGGEARVARTGVGVECVMATSSGTIHSVQPLRNGGGGTGEHFPQRLVCAETVLAATLVFVIPRPRRTS